MWNKSFNLRTTILCWHKALWLDVASHVASFNQSESIISEKNCFATLEFVYDIGSWLRVRIVFSITFGYARRWKSDVTTRLVIRQIKRLQNECILIGDQYALQMQLHYKWVILDTSYVHYVWCWCRSIYLDTLYDSAK